MQKILRKDAIHYVFDRKVPPLITVNPKESFVVETEDALSGRINTSEDLLTPENLRPFSEYEPEIANPLSGPIFVTGIEKGDVLVVTIEEIIPAEKGVTGVKPGQGRLWDSKKWASIHEKAYTHIIHHKPGPSNSMKDGIAIFNERISWDLRPFIGTIGVAPYIEVETSAVGQGVWGGNWDCRDIAPGSRIHLNSFNQGGLLYLGDVHGSQGDGEWSGIANEIRSEVKLHCDVIKNKKIPYARIEKEDSLISLYADRPLEAAVNKAMTDLLEWIVDDYSMDPREVYILFSVNPYFRINVYQMVKAGKINYTVGAEFPKRFLQ
ncbi:MAG: acetamidase/formamidase family protein [Candidatus Atribacteria bacterium]|nr:acetamidase/formamidase family protein [Candidatus Atribacteria bacterium]